MSAQTIEKLVYMANQIATAFRTQPEAAAVEATRDHIARFWDPRMRSMIGSYVDGGGEGLNQIAKQALRRG